MEQHRRARCEILVLTPMTNDIVEPCLLHIEKLAASPASQNFCALVLNLKLLVSAYRSLRNHGDDDDAHLEHLPSAATHAASPSCSPQQQACSGPAGAQVTDQQTASGAHVSAALQSAGDGRS